MNQLKRYLFWWICGALLVVELCLIAFWTPADAQGRDPEAVKGALDTQVKELGRVYDRSKRPMPGVFNAEDPADIQRLTSEFLITPKWEGVLKPAVDKYQAQLDGIAADLTERSKPLRDPLIDTTDLVAWQDQYKNESEALLKQLDEGGQLVLPEKSAKADAGIDEGSRFRDDDKVRQVAGLETPRGKTFPKEEHARLTARLRIVQHVADALIKVQAEAAPNPVVNKGKDALPPAKPRLAGLTWTDRIEPPKGPLASRVSDQQLATIRLIGPEAALVAAIAALEQLEKPVVVVTAATLERLDPGAGKRSADVVLPCQAKIELLVLDMTPAAKETK